MNVIIKKVLRQLVILHYTHAAIIIYRNQWAVNITK